MPKKNPRIEELKNQIQGAEKTIKWAEEELSRLEAEDEKINMIFNVRAMTNRISNEELGEISRKVNVFDLLTIVKPFMFVATGQQIGMSQELTSITLSDALVAIYR